MIIYSYKKKTSETNKLLKMNGITFRKYNKKEVDSIEQIEN